MRDVQAPLARDAVTPETVLLCVDDIVRTEAAHRAVVEARALLGEERERLLTFEQSLEATLEAHRKLSRRREGELYTRIRDAVGAYEALIRRLGQQYLSSPGEYQFRPDVGGFVPAARMAAEAVVGEESGDKR